jgi:hypothetical protein
MLDAFRNGGWGMYPTTIAGLVLIAAAVRYARQPDPRRLQVVRALSLLVFLVACLGFVAGVINSFAFATDKPDELAVYVVSGVGESLNCIGLGLAMLVIATIIRTYGVSRGGAPSGGAELHDPHAP